jgi:hypothetical protein
VAVKNIYFVHFFYYFYTGCTTVAPGIIGKAARRGYTCLFSFKNYLELIPKKVILVENMTSDILLINNEYLIEGFIVFDFILKYRIAIKTSNSLEKISSQTRIRKRIEGVFPKESSCLRMISARMIEKRE